MMTNLICPVSNVRIDRNVVRTTGALTTAALVAYAVTGSAALIVPVALDYLMRASMKAPMSPMARLARRVARLLGLEFRAMDKAPKVFASRIGVMFAVGAALAHFAAPGAAPMVALALAAFTFMESALDFCVGCVVYTYIALPLMHLQRAASAKLAA